MRVLHVIASVDPRSGGPVEGILLQEKVTGGIDGMVTREIVTIDPPDASYLAGYPLKVHALGGAVSGSPARRFLSHMRRSNGVAPWILANRDRFDLAFVHGLWNYSVFAASRALPGGPLPYFVFTHGMMDPWFRRRYPLKHMFKQIFWLVSEGRLLSQARAALFTCEEERLQAQGGFLGHRYREMVVDYGTSAPPAPTAAAHAAMREAIPFAGTKPFLLFLSRIHEKKGCDLLIDGFARMAAARPELQLVVAGPGTPALLAKLEAQVASARLAHRIHFPGAIFGNAKWAALAAAEAFILPSHQENFGIAVAEALACGTPVLISDKVNIWREIGGAGAGIIAPDTVDGVVQLLERWFAMSEEERVAMGASAAQLFSDRFDVAKTGPALLNKLAAEIGLEVPLLVGDH